MTNPESAPPTIVTQWIVANELISETEGRPDARLLIADGDERQEGGWRTATSRIVSNASHYLSGEGPYILIDFLDGTPQQKINPHEIIEVNTIQPGG